MVMGRPRRDGRKDWPRYLYKDRDGTYYLRFPGCARQALPGADFGDAVRLRDEVYVLWVGERRIEPRQPTPRAPRRGALLFADYCRRWREQKLPTLRKKNGKLVSAKTVADYDRMLTNQVEPAEVFRSPLTQLSATLLRQFLAQWLNSPAFYNQLLSVISRVLQDAVDEGLLERNPARDVARRGVAAREAYLSLEQYGAISAWDGWQEWQRRALDLIYLLTGRPGDVLSLREENVCHLTAEDPEGTGPPLDIVEVHFRASKNKQLVEVWEPSGGDLDKTLRWLAAWKSSQDLATPWLIPYPRQTQPRRLVGTPVTVEYISRRFSQAARAVGVAGFTLRDLRPAGYTREVTLGGHSDKLGDKSEAMKARYDRLHRAMRAQNRLTLPARENVWKVR
jgi:integrase